MYVLYIYVDCWKHAYRVNIHILRNKCINFSRHDFYGIFFLSNILAQIVKYAKPDLLELWEDL